MSNCTVVRIRPPGMDDNGDPIDSATAETPIAGCSVAPRTSADIADKGRQGVIIGATLYTPYAVDLEHTDQVRISGAGNLDGLYELDGEPGSWSSPFTTWTPGDEVALRRTTG